MAARRWFGEHGHLFAIGRKLLWQPTGVIADSAGDRRKILCDQQDAHARSMWGGHTQLHPGAPAAEAIGRRRLKSKVP